LPRTRRERPGVRRNAKRLDQFVLLHVTLAERIV
jgi:hypothetical protein